jgi:hypothetical protein
MHCECQVNGQEFSEAGLELLLSELAKSKVKVTMSNVNLTHKGWTYQLMYVCKKEGLRLVDVYVRST